MAGIYLHIPFCKQACYYCDFHFSTNQSLQGEMVAAMSQELELQKHYLEGQPVTTIYLGGGTPSLLPTESINTLLLTIRNNFEVSNHPEITLEGNPDDLTAEKLKRLYQCGINRLSIGILASLNRAHNGSAAVQCLHDARHAGFSNISIDLIYAIPGQTSDRWRADVLKAITLKPEHISSYSLTIEEKTVFGSWASAGKFKAVEDDASAQQLELLIDLLEEHGYEVSNFCLPGCESRHNSSYWKQQSYLGIGPSAHSYNGTSRQHNVSNNHLYLKALALNQIPFTREVLTREDKVNDYLLTTLRTAWGTNLEKLKQEYQYDLLNEHRPYLEALLNKELATLNGDALVLTRKGRMLADRISSDLFLVN
jgi:oxygen-independent coproporphyrinogen III oxidase